MQTNGDVVVAHGYQRFHPEAQRLLRLRRYGAFRLYGRTVKVDHFKPRAHIAQRVVFGVAAQVLDVHVEVVILAVWLDDGHRVLHPYQGILPHVGRPADGFRLVAVHVVNLVQGDVQLAAFQFAGCHARGVAQPDDHLAV